MSVIQSRVNTRDEAFAAEWDRIVEERHAFDDERFEELKAELAVTLLEQAARGIPRLKVSSGKVVRGSTTNLALTKPARSNSASPLHRTA